MTTVEYAHEPKLEKLTAEVLVGGSLAEAIGGAAAIILSIIALTGKAADWLLPLAGLAIGAALLAEGAAIAARFTGLLKKLGGGLLDITELGGGMSAEFIAGVTGVVLAVLALLGFAPMTLMPVAAMVYSGGLLLGAGTTARLRALALPAEEDRGLREVVALALNAATGVRILVGLAVGVLGLLALVAAVPAATLTLVAFLVAGLAVLFGGSAIAGTFLRVFGR